MIDNNTVRTTLIVLSVLLSFTCFLDPIPVRSEYYDYYSLLIDDTEIAFTPFFYRVKPNEKIMIRKGFAGSQLQVHSNFDGSFERINNSKLKWTAPDSPGLSTISFGTAKDSKIFTIHFFVQVPFENIEGGKLNGFRIGSYPDEPHRGLSVYEPPAWFMKLTADNQNIKISPHFQLQEFAPDQGESFPKYMLLREELILKLERILRIAENRDLHIDDFEVINGFRTPYVNDRMGNTPNSRHIWGGAADIYVDHRPPEGIMDDLDGNGVEDWNDSYWLAKFISSLRSKPELRQLTGGVGYYGSGNSHGPYVHLDARGYHAWWKGEGVVTKK